MNTLELSVCLIAKNEEKNIARCLESIKCIADEIILVDTGSEDKTIDIAKSCGAKVIEHPWNKDFSAARNVSLEAAQGKWILFLDCDEEIPREDAMKLKELVSQDKNEGYYLRLINVIDGKVIGSAIVLRLFRNRPEYRFKGKLHEQVIKEIQNRYGIESIQPAEIRIIHYGYDPNFTNVADKSKRNLDILLTFPEEEKDGYYYYALGNEYARVNTYDIALEHYLHSLQITNYKMYRYLYFPYLALNIVKSLNILKRHNDSIKYVKEFQRAMPDFKDLYFFEALCHMECLRYSKAKEAIIKYLEIKEGKFEYPTNNFEELYNIQDIMVQLNEAYIPHDDKLLSVLVFLREDYGDIEKCVKSINDTAHEVLLIDMDSNHELLEAARQAGGKILQISNKNFDKSLSLALRRAVGKWILVLNENEICSYVAQKELIPLIMDTKKEGFRLNFFNVNDNEITEEFRLFKNPKNVKDTLREIEANIPIEKIDNIDILIHRF